MEEQILIMYKILSITFLVVLSLTSCNEFKKDFTIHKHMISRAGWQWIMVADQDSFMVTNLADSLKENNRTATLKFEFTGKTDTLYQVGPVDLPVYYKSLPQIKILD